MAESCIKDLQDDLSDTDKKILVVRIGNQISSSTFTIEDSSGSAELTLNENAKKWRANVDSGMVFRLFGFRKDKGGNFQCTKNSFMLEEKNHEFSSDKVIDFIKLKDLIKYKPGDIVKENLMVKVLEVKDTAKTRNGTPYKKYLIADENASIRMTIWRNDILKFEKLLALGGVYHVTGFSVDNYPLNTRENTPKDIDIRYSSVIKEIEPQDIQKVLYALSIAEDNTYLEGIVKYITNVYEYLACPGNGGPCGKSVRENKMCEKCGINLVMVQPLPAYKCDLVFFDKDGVIYHITAFSSQLNKYEIDGKTVDEKLEKIMNKPVMIRMYEKDDDYILSKLFIQCWTIFFLVRTRYKGINIITYKVDLVDSYNKTK